MIFRRIPSSSALRGRGNLPSSIGPYLRPSPQHLPVRRYCAPAEFEELRSFAQGLGFAHVESGPLVRSSYHAEDQVPRQAVAAPLPGPPV